VSNTKKPETPSSIGYNAFKRTHHRTHQGGLSGEEAEQDTEPTADPNTQDEGRGTARESGTLDRTGPPDVGIGHGPL